MLLFVPLTNSRRPSRHPKMKNPRKRFVSEGFSLIIVTPIGFEPMAHSLEGCCSIQLSYGTSLLVLSNNLECEFNTFFPTLYVFF